MFVTKAHDRSQAINMRPIMNTDPFVTGTLLMTGILTAGDSDEWTSVNADDEYINCGNASLGATITLLRSV